MVDLDTADLVFGDNDEFYQNLDEFKSRWLERIRMIPVLIQNIPYCYWTLLTWFLPLFLRQYIAVIVFVLSTYIFILLNIFLGGDERIIAVLYCFTFMGSSFISLYFKQGCFLIASEHNSESQKLIPEFDRRNGQEAHQPIGYGAKDERQLIQRNLENVMEPRQEAGATTDFHHCCCAGDAAGSSSAPECNCIIALSSSDDNLGSHKPSQALIVARLHPDAINFFGPPDKVYGADSYVVLNDSYEEVCAGEETD